MFRKVFDILPVGLWIADKSGKLIRGNPTGNQNLGRLPLGFTAWTTMCSRRVACLHAREIAPEDWALAPHGPTMAWTITDELLEIDAFDGVARTILNSHRTGSG